MTLAPAHQSSGFFLEKINWKVRGEGLVPFFLLLEDSNTKNTHAAH